jgi:glycosyltransferase involved in cell wall biosynthesis
MAAPRRGGGIGYVLRKFPVLSETFVLNEILALEAQGVPIRIFSLARPNLPRFHEDLPKLRAEITYVPEGLEIKEWWQQCVQAAKRYRGGFWRMLLYALSRGHPMFLWRFIQSCAVANKAAPLNLQHLHAHFASRATNVALLASKMTGLPYSFTPHAFDIFCNRVKRRHLAQKIAGARFVVAISDYNKAYLERQWGGPSDKIVRIDYGIWLDRFVPNGRVPSEPITIVCVARLVEKKGVPVLVEACKQLRDRHRAFRCWIIGTGRLRQRLSQMIRDWALREHVFLLGAQPQQEVLRRYQSSHLFVLPSIVASDGNREGLPLSILEALACGLPVVSTPITGIPEAVRTGFNGILVDPGDATGLADAIERLMQDRGLYDRLRANARASVETRFDIEKNAGLLRGWFEQSDGGKHAP